MNPAAVSPAEAGPAAVPNPAASLEARRQQAERLVGEWLAARREHDVGHLVRLAETPYYFDQEILVSRESIADKYRELFKEKPTVLEGVRIEKIRARTVGEMKEEGASLQRDRIFGSLSLSDQGWEIQVQARTRDAENSEGMIMFARQVGDQSEIVGTWD